MFSFRKIKKILILRIELIKQGKIGEIRGKLPLFSCQHNEPML